VYALNPSVAAHLSAHHGVVTKQQLEALGITRHQLNRLLRDRILVPYVYAVYRLAAAPATPEQAAALACATGPDVVVSHISAGRHWGLRALGPDSRLHVEVAGQHHQRLSGVVTHRTYRLDPIDVVEQPDGIRYTSPPRTVFDLASMLSDDRLESVIEQVLHDGLATMPTLLATVERLRQRGRKGSARVGRVIASRPAWLKPVDSELELRVERAILAAGLPRPQRQHPVWLPSGEMFRLDFYWPDELEALEIDHITWHGGKREQTADKRRDRLLRHLGINTTRITDDDVRSRLPLIVHELGAILARSRVRSMS
jgi:very-short-patch-repair endonuclease